ncbi:MAG: RNA methyltransferase [SAR202 cluster bacterium Io17-Chloro-G9]|nr:MAG: RNA methyltransferase [SAR202 cluster bacterium Io17-Chloro-G9]
MPYNDELALRIRIALEGQDGMLERKMFGGLCFMLNGNVCCGVTNDDMMVRVGPNGQEEALAQPGARPMDFTGRSIKGFVFVGLQATLDDQVLAQWVERGVAFARTLPVK